MIDAGTHKNVKIVGCYLGESKEKKTPYFGIEFELENGESIDNQFYLTDTMIKRGNKEIQLMEANLDDLIKMGYIGKQISDMADETKDIDDLFGPIKDPINLVIAHEEFTTDDGEIKTAAKVKYVNVGYRSNVTKFDHKTAVVKFKNMNLDGKLMSIRKNMPKDNIPF